ncbi:hypothetical protein ACP275_06G013200 [Erythranthe tilingii]
MTITDNEDLLIEILLYLPAKTLIGFKLVSKKWFSTISDRHFSRRHSQQRHRLSKPESSLLLRCLGDSPEYLYLQSKLQPQKSVRYHFSPSLIDPTIWSFSNGLFLLVNSSTINDPLEYCHIYNPTTKQSKKILLNTHERFTFVIGLNLAFDPLKSPYYRIVCVRATRRRRPPSFLRGWYRYCQIEVYESGTDTWQLCGEPFLVPRDVDFNHGVYWEGGIHWGGIYFDLLESSICKHPELVELPEDAGIKNFQGNYVESNGSLHYMAHFSEENLVMVFELQSNCSQWLLKYRINLERGSEPLSVLSFIRGESEGDSMLVLCEPGKVIGYQIGEKSVKELIDFSDKEQFYKAQCVQFGSDSTFQFIETLAPV